MWKRTQYLIIQCCLTFYSTKHYQNITFDKTIMSLIKKERQRKINSEYILKDSLQVKFNYISIFFSTILPIRGAPIIIRQKVSFDLQH